MTSFTEYFEPADTERPYFTPEQISEMFDLPLPEEIHNDRAPD